MASHGVDIPQFVDGLSILNKSMNIFIPVFGWTTRAQLIVAECWDNGTAVILVSHVTKLRLREVKFLAQGHPDSKGWREDSSSGLSDCRVF